MNQSPEWHPRQSQRGVVLIFALVALVIVLAGAAAVVRSMNASVFTSANYGFKRDLGNQGERAVDAVLEQFNTGALSTEAGRENDSLALNYKASILPTNSQGIPLQLLPGGDLASVGTNVITRADMGITINYVVDRLCNAPGSLGANACIWANAGPPKGGGDVKLGGSADGVDLNTGGGKSAVPRQAVYRLTALVTGPRNTRAYYQSTFTD